VGTAAGQAAQGRTRDGRAGAGCMIAVHSGPVCRLYPAHNLILRHLSIEDRLNSKFVSRKFGHI
jgi:hypothetical protein